VGATNVGSIKLDHDDDIITNQFMPDQLYSDKSYINDTKTGPFHQYFLQEDF
jgi:hypothetical protein